MEEDEKVILITKIIDIKEITKGGRALITAADSFRLIRFAQTDTGMDTTDRLMRLTEEARTVQVGIKLNTNEDVLNMNEDEEKKREK